MSIKQKSTTTKRGASIRPSTYTTRPDWVARLKERQYGMSNPRSEVVSVRQFPEHLLRWLKVFGDEAGKSLQEAAAFALEEGGRTLLSLDEVDAIERARKVIDKRGTAFQHRTMKAFAFKPSTPEGYEELPKVSFRVPKSVKDNLTALQAKLQLQKPEALAILVVLVDVTVLPGETREQLYGEAKRFLAYIREWAREATAMAVQIERQPAARGSERSMNDLLARPVNIKRSRVDM